MALSLASAYHHGGLRQPWPPWSSRAPLLGRPVPFRGQAAQRGRGQRRPLVVVSKKKSSMVGKDRGDGQGRAFQMTEEDNLYLAFGRGLGESLEETKAKIFERKLRESEEVGLPDTAKGNPPQGTGVPSSLNGKPKGSGPALAGPPPRQGSPTLPTRPSSNFLLSQEEKAAYDQAMRVVPDLLTPPVKPFTKDTLPSWGDEDTVSKRSQNERLLGQTKVSLAGPPKNDSSSGFGSLDDELPHWGDEEYDQSHEKTPQTSKNDSASRPVSLTGPPLEDDDEEAPEIAEEELEKEAALKELEEEMKIEEYGGGKPMDIAGAYIMFDKMLGGTKRGGEKRPQGSERDPRILTSKPTPPLPKLAAPPVPGALEARDMPYELFENMIGREHGVDLAPRERGDAPDGVIRKTDPQIPSSKSTTPAPKLAAPPVPGALEARDMPYELFEKMIGREHGVDLAPRERGDAPDGVSRILEKAQEKLEKVKEKAIALKRPPLASPPPKAPLENMKIRELNVKKDRNNTKFERKVKVKDESTENEVEEDKEGKEQEEGPIIEQAAIVLAIENWSPEVQAAVARSEAEVQKAREKEIPTYETFDKLLAEQLEPQTSQRKLPELRRPAAPPSQFTGNSQAENSLSLKERRPKLPTPGEVPETSRPAVSVPSSRGVLSLRKPTPGNGPLVKQRSPREGQIDVDAHFWQQAEEALQSNTSVEVTVVNSNSGGVQVLFKTLLGFIPQSQLSAKRRPPLKITPPSSPPATAIERSIHQNSENLLTENSERVSAPPEDENSSAFMRQQRALRAAHLATLIGQKLTVKVLEAERSKQRLIFSERLSAGNEDDGSRARARLIKEIKVGDVVKGKVTQIAKYGAFVEVQGALCLIHRTELAWAIPKRSEEVVRLGQEIEAQVIGIETASNRITLSLRRLQPDPLLETLDSLVEHSPGEEANAVDIEELGGFIKRLEDLGTITSVTLGRRLRGQASAPTFQVFLAATPSEDGYKLLARTGVEIQEILVKTTLDKEGMKEAVRNATVDLGTGEDFI